MASKTVVWTVGGLVGETGLTLLVFAEGGNSAVNGAGDALTNSAYGRLTCTVTEALAGWYDAVIIDGSSNIVTERGPDAKVYFIGDVAGTYVVGSNVTLTQYQADILYFQPVVRSAADNKAISFLWPLTGRSFTGSTKVIDQGASSAITGAITELGGVGDKYEYSIAYNAADRPTVEGTVRYTLTDGTNTRYLTLRVERSSVEDTGATSYEIVVNDTDSVPIDHCLCWVANDEAGTDVISDIFETDSFGKVNFVLVPGTYWLFRQKNGVTFSVNPKEFTIV